MPENQFFIDQLRKKKGVQDKEYERYNNIGRKPELESNSQNKMIIR
jgi:hypothetical protein